VFRDEFTIAITDSAGYYRSWSTSEVKVTIKDPLQAHAELLPKYSDADIHNLFAYLQTLK
jgi:cytochrome c oxidase cbb3-type subunit 3